MSLNNRQDNRDPKAVKQKAAEVKLHLLGVMQTMQKEGKMPHNTELNDLLEKLKTNRIISSREHLMSTDGKNLLHDFRDLLNVIQKALIVKNKDELFQSLVYHIHCMDTPISKENIRESIKSQNRGASAQQEGKKGSNALMKIVKLMLINNEFRSVLGELLDISQDIFNNMTHKMGNSIQQTGSNNNNNNRSGKERMDNVLDSAVNRLDDNQEYHRDRSGSRSSYHDREPQLINAPSDDHRHQGLLNTGDTVHPRAIPGILSDINTNVASSGGIQNPEYSHLPPNTMNHISGKSVNAPRHSTNMASGTYNNYGPQEGYSSGTGNINAPSGNKPYYSEQQDNFHHNDFNTQQRNQSHPYAQHARDTVDEHKQYARDTVNEKLPQEKQDELIRRLKNALAEVERNPDFQSAISTLIHLIKTWSNRLSHVSDNMKSEAKQNETPEQMDYKDRAQSEFKAILETWTQGFSIDPLLNGVQNVMHDMEHDDALRNYYDSIVNYVKRLVRDPEYARRDASTEDGRKLMDKGNSIIKDRYRDHLDYLTSESRHYMRLMTDDEIAQELRNCVSKIHNDLWKDNDGNPAFKPHLFNDMRMTLLPAFIDEIKYIPIPRIEYSDAQYDIAIENLILSGDSLLPNVFDTKLESFNSFSLKTDAPSKPSHQSMLIRMSEIQAKVEDVVFYYKKKTGFPRISDSGVASLNIGGKGITVTTRINSIVDDPTRTFKVTYCKCNVDNLSIKVNDSHHDILYKAIRPLVIGQIRKQISKGVEMKVIDTLNQIDQRLTSSITHMNQKLQDKAYNALPEEERVNLSAANTSSQAQTRHGFFSTVVNLINHNIKQRSTRHR
ncbi:uncharacterized protein BX663DRAFT_432187, partial [Cokeromyces recurvatus]|uniref:uncharacterized protein n=1 Tax=Cokeromyces recurvatus TaxID=90255 RepID=UPI002220DA91